MNKIYFYEFQFSKTSETLKYDKITKMDYKIKTDQLEYYEMHPMDLFGSWIIPTQEMSEEFIHAKPYSHLVIENFLSDHIFEKVSKEFPEVDDNWNHYCNPIEIKYSFDRLDLMKQPFQSIFYSLSTKHIIEKIEQITRIKPLEHDPYLHGAGLHCLKRNGRLGMHLDYEKHPITGKERRLNLILFLSTEWKEEWNGALEFWSNNMNCCEKKIYPKPNRAVLFQTNDVSWHGIPDKILCPEPISRRSLAYYWVSELETKKNKDMYRLKAKFVKRPFELEDARMKELYGIRANRLITKDDLHRIYPEWTVNL